jgi:hypothetical protein
MKRWLFAALGAVAVLAAYYFYTDSVTAKHGVKDSMVVTKNKSGVALNSTEIKNAAVSNRTQFTLHGSTDYAALKAYYEPLAEKGDPKARRIIAQIYEHCLDYSRSPKTYGETIDVMMKFKPDDPIGRLRLKKIKEQTEQRCKLLDKGLPITKELLDFSWAQASAASDSLATFKIATELQILKPDQALNGEMLDSMVNRAIDSGDAETIFVAGELLRLNSNSATYADVFGEINNYAWQIAACRIGGANMCGQNSILMTDIACMGMGDCSSTNYESMVRNGIPPCQLEALNIALSRIENLIQQRRNEK